MFLNLLCCVLICVGHSFLSLLLLNTSELPLLQVTDTQCCQILADGRSKFHIFREVIKGLQDSQKALASF